MSTSDFEQSKQLMAQASSMLLGELGPSAAASINWRECFPDIIGRSKPLIKVLETVSRIARSDGAVLISGESGTGKELIAAALHRLSSRSGRRFVAINCSAIPENLLESELFGHEKGAFTGAINRRPGLFEIAEGGTLFLDEIGDMPAMLQVKLLRVLQEKQYTSVGGHVIKSANVRIVAATNLDLEKAVNLGRFRLDLFYRLNVLPIMLPPLREREGDVSELLNFFLENANRVHGMTNHAFLSEEVREFLCRYEWPGNVRELQNLVERLVIMRNGGEITMEHLPSEFLRPRGQGFVTPPAQIPSVPAPAAIQKASELVEKKIFYPENFGTLPNEGLDLTSYIENLENQLILQALDRTGNNKNQAAKLLGLNRTTLVERLKKRKINVPNG